MMTAEPMRRVSPEDYLAMEELSETRNELIDGVVVAMSGNSYGHLRIVRNVVVELDGRLRGKACEVLCNELRVKVELTGDYFYPDSVGVCGPPLFDRLSQVTLLNPSLLIEVLSPSSDGIRPGAKVSALPADSNLEGVRAGISGGTSAGILYPGGELGVDLQDGFRIGSHRQLCLDGLHRGAGGYIPRSAAWRAAG